MNFKWYRPHTWLEIEESNFPYPQPISQITKLKRLREKKKKILKKGRNSNHSPCFKYMNEEIILKAG